MAILLSVARLVAWGFVLGQVASQGLEAVEECGRTCVDSALAIGPSIGCDDSAASCLCKSPDFGYAMRDCALQACPESVVAQVTNYATALCATATISPAAAAETATPTEAAPSETTATDSANSEAPTERPEPSTAPQSSADGSEETTTPSSTERESSSSPAKTSEAEPTTNPDADVDSAAVGGSDEDGELPSKGLSVGAKAGIGIGVGAVAIALLSLAFCLITRSRNKAYRNSHNFNISGPMPGSGRDYADSHLDYKEKAAGKSELELKSRRYEDMVPRQQPSSMI